MLSKCSISINALHSDDYRRMLLSHSDHINGWVSVFNYIEHDNGQDLLLNTIFSSSYGDVYPMSSLARFVAMLASPLSMMMLSLPLSAIYAAYASTYEIYQMQLKHPDLVRYVVHDTTGTTGQHSQVQRRAIADVTTRVNSNLKFFRTNRP